MRQATKVVECSFQRLSESAHLQDDILIKINGTFDGVVYRVQMYGELADVVPGISAVELKKGVVNIGVIQSSEVVQQMLLPFARLPNIPLPPVSSRAPESNKRG